MALIERAIGVELWRRKFYNMNIYCCLFWSNFEHFWMAGSIPSYLRRELFRSLTRCFGGTSSFEREFVAYWRQKKKKSKDDLS